MKATGETSARQLDADRAVVIEQFERSEGIELPVRVYRGSEVEA